MNRIAEIFIRPFPYAEKVSFFKRILYIFLIINSLTLIPIVDQIFAYPGILGSSGWYSGTPWYLQGSRALVNLLSHPYNLGRNWIAYVFLFGQLLFLILGLIGRLPRLSAILVYFFTVNLFGRGYLVFTGGETLINLLLFYLIFIDTRKKSFENNDLQNLANNTFYWIMLIQICLLYFFSNFYKLMDPAWQSGEAIMFVSRINAYSSNLMHWLFADNLFLSQLATYSVLAYQALFPILVWNKRIKIPFLVYGVVLHLGIAFGMGIFTFGIVMIISYLLFLSNDQIIRLKKFIKSLFLRLKLKDPQ
ncbi:hypothetical protein [Crocinitomix algicola]|uniref:hypothetical protein n=1 Tax=Crocinitomix algicola TaxID=1740263 RepID=UPI0008363592|nr:hypothetical protein [Crocinitomix algicola]